MPRKVAMPDPPVEGRGKWVDRKAFRGHKSFGHFCCFPCGDADWVSAHAYKHYKQACKQCGEYYLPIHMWVNFEGRKRHHDSDYDPRKHHKQELCEACKKGVCQL